MASPAASEVYIIDASDRYHAVKTLWREIGLPPFDGKAVAVKANFNSDDPFPATTHPDMLEAVLGQIRDAGAGTVRLGERSGMGETRAVLENRGAVDVAARSGAEVTVLDGLPPRVVGGNPAGRSPLGARVSGRPALPGGRCGGPDLLLEDPPVRRARLPLPEEPGGGRCRERPGGRLQLHGGTACLDAPAQDDRRD